MERIDLHVHTLASDGSDAPETVVRKAAAAGLRAVAITDHDTFAGLPEALAAGTARGIEVVPGVELSTVWGGEEVHLLGYYMDTDNAALRALMTRATDERNARNETMVQRLHDAGYPITMAERMRRFRGRRCSAGRTSRRCLCSAAASPRCPTGCAVCSAGASAFMSRATTFRWRIPCTRCARRAACRSWRICSSTALTTRSVLPWLAAGGGRRGARARGALHDLFT